MVESGNLRTNMNHLIILSVRKWKILVEGQTGSDDQRSKLIDIHKETNWVLFLKGQTDS